MLPFSNAVGGWGAEFHSALVRARWQALLLFPSWIALPFLIASLLHPLDVVKWDHFIHGWPLPHTASAQQLTVAVTEVLLTGAAIAMWQVIATVAFYRKAQIVGLSVATPRLWPVAAVLVGGLGNLAWFIGLGGELDLSYAVGFSSALVTILIERFCEELGRDFVIGVPTGSHPPV